MSSHHLVHTNSAGVVFRRRVTGFYRPGGSRSLDARGARYLVNSDSPWMPVTESSLRQDEENAHVEPGLCTACGAETFSVIGCPDGAEVCQSCFDAGAH